VNAPDRRELAVEEINTLIFLFSIGNRMKSYLNIVPFLSIMAIAGCATTQSGTGSAQSQPAPAAPAPTATTNEQPAVATKSQPANNGEGTFVGTPAKNSKFAKLKIGMGRKEVEDLIGHPNDSHTYVTGKAWIPFYFGKDAYRFQTFYKNEGSLTFEGGGVTGTSGKLIRVNVDAASNGYAPTN
jgi:hypothetical protein